MGTFSALTRADKIVPPVSDSVVSMLENVSLTANHKTASKFKCLPGDHLTPMENNRLNLLLDQYSDVFPS